MRVLRQLADRTAVLFLGVGVGTAMGYTFAGDLHDAVSGDAPARQVAAPPAQAPAGAAVSAATATPIECAMPFQPRLLQTISTGGKIRVGVFGDSFGDGVWAALYHQLQSRENFQVIKYSQQSTGFTRYASLNLENHVAEQLAEGPIDVAVISFGANDTQGVMHDGHYAALLSPAWKEEIGARIERYIGLLRRQGAIVYWVGLPVMRKASFDADISGMSRFFAEEMKRLDVPFIDTRPMSVDAQGAYAAYLPEPGTGTPRLMRANDGIHMSMGGYQRLTAGLAERIKRYVGAARAHAIKDGPVVATAALAPPASKTEKAPAPPAKTAVSEPKQPPATAPVMQAEPKSIIQPKLPEPAFEAFGPANAETLIQQAPPAGPRG